MPLRNVVVLAERVGRGHSLAEAAQTVTRCRISDPKESWIDLERVRGVIVDVSLDRDDARQCLKTLASRLSGQQMPLIYLLRTQRDAELREAERYGATACFAAWSPPQTVIAGLFRQIAPEKTMTDLLVEHSFDRAGELFEVMFKESRVDLDAIDDEIDPIVRALQEGGLQRWLDLVQAHDDATVKHCLLVAGLVANFTLHLSLPEADRTSLLRAGLVHDVGKTQIPLAILNKPGPLDADEMTVMRTHASVGHAMLITAGMSDPVTLAVARYHHEMLDGSGYPDGLRGGEIKDAVRLLTICDIYAALTERRPYRAAMTQAQALAILRSMTPNRLETALVEAFASSLAATA